MSEKINSDVLRSLLGNKINDILRRTTDIQRYLWEQVLAVCLYSRRALIREEHHNHRPEESSRDFYNRIQLVHCLTKLIGKDLAHQNTILQKLNEGASSYEIAEVLKPLNLKSVIRDMEALNIAFPRSHSAHYYTYWQMYLSMVNPIEIFQQLLKINLTEEDLSTLAANFFRNERKIFRLERNLNLQERLNEKLDDMYVKHAKEMHDSAEELSSYLDKLILTSIGDSTKKIMPSSPLTDISESIHKFSKHVVVNSDRDNVKIELKKNYITSLENIGQYDSLIESIRESILQETSIQSTNKYNTSLTKAIPDHQKIIQISNWQKNNSMGLVRRLDQCPRIVASIINYDLSNGRGIFDKKICTKFLNYLSVNKSRSDTVQDIAKIFRYFLYFSYLPGEVINDIHSGYDDVFQHNKNLTHEQLNPKKILPNRLMASWASDNLKQTTEMYKKIPKKIFGDSKSLIEMQIKSSQGDVTTNFPLKTQVPLPFWVNF